MKKLLFFIGLFFFSINYTFAQVKIAGKISFNDLERIVNNQDIPAYYLEGKLFSGTTYDEYLEDEVAFEYHIQDGLLEKHLGWHFDGTKEREFYFKKGLPHGKLIGYHRDGKTKYFEENYINGAQEGMQRGWNSDGSLRYEATYTGGVKVYQMDYAKKGEIPKTLDKC